MTNSWTKWVSIGHLNQSWLLLIHTVLIAAPFFSLSAQVLTHEQLTGTWIGVHTEYDADVFCPLPTYMKLDADSTYYLGMVDGSAAPIRSTWAVSGNSVRLDTIHFTPGLVKVENNLLRIGVNYPMVFRQFNNSPIDSVTAYRQLVGRVWQSDSLLVSLYANGRVSLENRATRQRTAHFWRLVRFDKSVFLVILGNQHDRNGGYKPLWQLSSVSPRQMQLIGWNGRAVATEPFRLVRSLAPADSCQPSGFQNCTNCFRKTWYLPHSGNLYELRQLIATRYQPLKRPGESGLVRVSFVLNCAGTSGLFDVQGFDDAYRSKPFSNQITSQLLAICREYVVTSPLFRLDDKSGDRSHDQLVSFTFRLKDGQFIDLLP